MGEFMLPILEPDEKLHEKLTPQARDLGRALQMTNIIRAITTEDWELVEKYIPEELRNRHNLNADGQHSNQPGIQKLSVKQILKF